MKLLTSIKFLMAVVVVCVGISIGTVMRQNQPDQSLIPIHMNAIKMAMYIDKVCYDGKNQIILVHSRYEDGEDWSGWYYEPYKKLDFMELSNNSSILLNDLDMTIFNKEIYPDVRGLVCA